MSKLVFIKEIKQEDKCHFSILWNDDKKQRYNLSVLQKNCPCVLCKDSVTNDSLEKEDLAAKSIKSVGVYAIKIEFEKGCSSGLYTYDMLRDLGAVCD